MTIYQRLLLFYLDSDQYFNQLKQEFFERYNYEGECIAAKHFETYLQCNEDRLEFQYFESEQHRRWRLRLERGGGHSLVLPDILIHDYFIINYSKNVCRMQLFSLVFAHWVGLSDKQIQSLKVRKNASQTMELLHSHILALGAKEIPDFYYITIDKEEHTARIEGDTLIALDTGEEYKIV